MFELAKDIVTLGAGVVALAFIFWAIYEYIKRLAPAMIDNNKLLGKLCDNDERNTEVIENNTKAIYEVSRSNDNVASALNILDATFSGHMEIIKQTNSRLEKHDERSERIEAAVIVIKERVKTV